MRRDAESHAEEDKQKFELATLRNQADNMTYQLEKMMKENADKLSDADKAPLEKAIETTREKAKGTDVAAIKSAVEQLEAASHAFSKVLYEKGAAATAASTSDDIDTGPAAGAGSHTTQPKGDDDVIEGEFEVKK
jgi:molecular chaperone DnaK